MSRKIYSALKKKLRLQHILPVSRPKSPDFDFMQDCFFKPHNRIMIKTRRWKREFKGNHKNDVFSLAQKAVKKKIKNLFLIYGK